MGLGFMMIFSGLKQEIIPKPAKYILVFRAVSIEQSGLLQGRLGRSSRRRVFRKRLGPKSVAEQEEADRHAKTGQQTRDPLRKSLGVLQADRPPDLKKPS